MTRKIFGPKSITHLVYGILMLLPFLAIGVRCMYVICNKNAKDSYTGSVSYSTSMLVKNYVESTSVTNTEYTLNDVLMHKLTGSNLDGYFRYNVNFNIPSGQYFTVNSGVVINATEVIIDNELKQECKSVAICKNNSLYAPFYIYLFDELYSENLYLELTSNNTANASYKDINGVTQVTNYSYVTIYSNGTFYNPNISLTNISNSIYYLNSYTPLNMFEKDIFFVETTLSGVFESSINYVLDAGDNFVPKNDFVSLLNGVFFNTNNHIYLRLTNWYLNYALLISTIYILFLAMLWFVNLCRNILERSMNIGNGVD